MNLLRIKIGYAILLALFLTSTVTYGARPKIGEVFPDITGTTLDGKPFKLSDLRGKPVLVDFWATWCMPCIAEMPNIRKAYSNYHDLGFEVVGVSLDESLADLQGFVQRGDFPWPILQFPGGWHSKWAAELEVTSIPTLFFIGPDGILLSRRAQGPRLIERVRHALDPNYPLVPDIEEEFDAWEDAASDAKEPTENRLLSWAASPAMAIEVNNVLWPRLLEGEKSPATLEFLGRLSERVQTTFPNLNTLDTYAYSRFLAGDAKGAADAQQKALDRMKAGDVENDYLWVLDARRALYLATAGEVEKASATFGAALGHLAEAKQIYVEPVDWLGEVADILDADYPEMWLEQDGVDRMFYYARFQGPRPRLIKRYNRLLESLASDESRADYAIAFGRFVWPENLKAEFESSAEVPLGLDVVNPADGFTLVRLKKADPKGDFAILLDAAKEGTPLNLAISGTGIESVTKSFLVSPGGVQDLGEIPLQGAAP